MLNLQTVPNWIQILSDIARVVGLGLAIYELRLSSDIELIERRNRFPASRTGKEFLLRPVRPVEQIIVMKSNTSGRNIYNPKLDSRTSVLESALLLYSLPGRTPPNRIG